MKDFGSWLHDLGKENFNSNKIHTLPIGVYKNIDGKYYVDCYVCEKMFICDYIDELPLDEEIKHYCGGSPRCCP